jgi:hypothetical protein
MLLYFLELRLTDTAGIGTAWRREDFNKRSEQNWWLLSRNQVGKALELLLRVGGVRGLGKIFRALKTIAPALRRVRAIYSDRVFVKSGGPWWDCPPAAFGR